MRKWDGDWSHGFEEYIQQEMERRGTDLDLSLEEGGSGKAAYDDVLTYAR